MLSHGRSKPSESGRPELKIRADVVAASHPNDLVQVAAAPIRFEGGEPWVMLVTSRETKRWVIPKGWPMRGKKNWAAAAQEAKEEAGIIGKTYKRSVGEFFYFKRRAAHFDLCRVEVYLIGFEKQLDVYREKGQRETCWFPLDEAADVVQEPGLSALLKEIDFAHFQKPTKKKLVNAVSKKNRKKVKI
jgi:8-oxo-dGTP pyrophosphatase MutT (NUDIX family)